KVGLTDVPALHLPPVIFRRRVFGWRRLDVARLFSVEDTQGARSHQLAPPLRRLDRTPEEHVAEKDVEKRENRRIGRISEPVQRRVGLMRDTRGIDVHQMPENGAVRGKMS